MFHTLDVVNRHIQFCEIYAVVYLILHTVYLGLYRQHGVAGTRRSAEAGESDGCAGESFGGFTTVLFTHAKNVLNAPTELRSVCATLAHLNTPALSGHFRYLRVVCIIEAQENVVAISAKATPCKKPLEHLVGTIGEYRSHWNVISICK